MTLLQNSWSILLELHSSIHVVGDGLSNREIRSDLTYYSLNRFSVLEEGDDFYPPEEPNYSRIERKNIFLSSTMTALGGGESDLKAKLSDQIRIGGGVDDGWRTLRFLDHDWSDHDPYTIDDDSIGDFLGIRKGELKPLSHSEAASMVSQNLDANPGPSYKALGFKKKRDSLALAMDIARLIHDEASKGPIIGFVPRYGMAGRNKVGDRESFRKKALIDRPLGRMVFMADQHEAIVAGRFTQPLLYKFINDIQVIVNGFNKFGDHPKILAKKIARFGGNANCDFSGFDNNCSPIQIRRAFRFIRWCFDIQEGTKDGHLLNWLEDQFVNTRVVLHTGRTILVKGGVPSGSGFTALVDSLINAINWLEILKKNRIDDFELFVQGDDNLIALPVKGPPSLRKLKMEDYLRKFSKDFFDMFGHVMNPNKSHIGITTYVKYAQPKVPVGIEDHSRQVVSQYRKELRNQKGRPLRFNEMFEVLEDEPVGPAPGMTHRWTYVFFESAKFLSHFFKKDSSSHDGVMMIRPTAEVVRNLLCPEGRVVKLSDHIERLKSALVENMGNHHVTNRIMHYLYDARIMQKSGVNRRLKGVHLPGRAWYRKIDRQIDLLDEDDSFREYWRKFEASARHAHTACFGGLYAEWGQVRALRKGKQRFMIGGPVSRIPNLGDQNELFKPSFIKALGPMGFNLWASPHTRLFLLGQVAKIFSGVTYNLQNRESLFLRCLVEELREDYTRVVPP